MRDVIMRRTGVLLLLALVIGQVAARPAVLGPLAPLRTQSRALQQQRAGTLINAQAVLDGAAAGAKGFKEMLEPASDLAKASTALQDLGKLAGAAGFLGGVVGIAAGLAGLFGGPTPEQQILEELERQSLQLDEMQEQLRDISSQLQDIGAEISKLPDQLRDVLYQALTETQRDALKGRLRDVQRLLLNYLNNLRDQKAKEQAVGACNAVGDGDPAGVLDALARHSGADKCGEGREQGCTIWALQQEASKQDSGDAKLPTYFDSARALIYDARLAYEVAGACDQLSGVEQATIHSRERANSANFATVARAVEAGYIDIVLSNAVATTAHSLSTYPFKDNTKVVFDQLSAQASAYAWYVLQFRSNCNAAPCDTDITNGATDEATQRPPDAGAFTKLQIHLNGAMLLPAVPLELNPALMPPTTVNLYVSYRSWQAPAPSSANPKLDQLVVACGGKPTFRDLHVCMGAEAGDGLAAHLAVPNDKVVNMAISDSPEAGFASSETVETGEGSAYVFINFAGSVVPASPSPPDFSCPDAASFESGVDFVGGDIPNAGFMAGIIVCCTLLAALIWVVLAVQTKRINRARAKAQQEATTRQAAMAVPVIVIQPDESIEFGAKLPGLPLVA